MFNSEAKRHTVATSPTTYQSSYDVLSGLLLTYWRWQQAGTEPSVVSEVDDTVNTLAKDIFPGIFDVLAHILSDKLHLARRVHHKQEALKGLKQNTHSQTQQFLWNAHGKHEVLAT